ncbi:MAG TPA: class I SAM-dependent methyltransferase [Gaiellaceae bacterium]|nr:class I SAM-dependent methyltransferase [Gaiellaceae bacterium]
MAGGDGAAELRERVAAFEYWHYEFDLGGGVVTPIADPTKRARHAERRRYFFDPVVELLGGLQGRRVLDLGCNAGFWSLAAIEAGAEFVLGIEGRRTLLDQAELVFDAKGVDRSRYEFRLADVFDVDLGDARFDVVLCLGLLYHVNRPVELLRRISGWNGDVLVVDTDLSSLAGSAFELRRESTGDPRNSLADELILWPTARAVHDLVAAFGYACVELEPRFGSWEGSPDFRAGRRRAFVCAKRTPLDALAAAQRARRSDLADAVVAAAPAALRPVLIRGRVRAGRWLRRLGGLRG